MKIKLIIIPLIVIFTLTTGCQGQNDKEEERGIEGQSVPSTDIEDADPTDVANHLAELCTKVPHVEKATAIVVGPYALVGIDVDGNIDQSEVGAIKYQVAEALAHDPYGVNAVVSADPDIIDRIKEMRQEMANGRPAQAIMDELAAIIGRIIPITPGEEHRKSRKTTDMNDENMNEMEENELEQIRKEQSKGKMDNKQNNEQ